MPTLHGPFSQLLPMTSLSLQGPLKDAQLITIENAGILEQNGQILEIGTYSSLQSHANHFCHYEVPCVALPGFIDAHTHLCFAGSRYLDYADRLNGVSYLDIAARGGGILSTVKHTREASEEELAQGILSRCKTLKQRGITTCEVKSGYGLSVKDELKMLHAIRKAQKNSPVNLIPTCLAAHTLPPEFSSHQEYLRHITKELLPLIQKESLSSRVDIFIEENAFSIENARDYLKQAKQQGFSLTIHADQFTVGGSLLAAELGALSADHLEQTTEKEMALLKKSNVIPVVLPGATLGLGMDFSPARALLDHGLSLAIASDWNPGSAPMGNLLTQAALLGANQKLSAAETLSGLTCRAALALGLKDRGILKKGYRADFVVFPCEDYREILYYQGTLHPSNTISS